VTRNINFFSFDTSSDNFGEMHFFL
jgi:hypothetical protein